MTQGIGVVTGLQDRFSWTAVAASAVGAEVGDSVRGAVGDALQNSGLNDFAQKLVTGTAAGLAAGTTTALMRGGRVSVQQVATDAFGQALGNSLVDEIVSSEAEARRQVARENFRGSGGVSESDYWNSRAPTQADRYAQTFGGEVALTGGDTVNKHTSSPGSNADLAQDIFRRSEIEQMNEGANANAAQQELERINEVLRETRGRGPTRGELYRSLAWNSFRDFDNSGQQTILVH